MNPEAAMEQYINLVSDSVPEFAGERLGLPLDGRNCGRRWSCRRSAGRIEEQKEEHLLAEKNEEEMIRKTYLFSLLLRRDASDRDRTASPFGDRTTLSNGHEKDEATASVFLKNEVVRASTLTPLLSERSR
ncbi:hypothetical protein ACLOJK_039509 [Asimina triloba]